MYELNPVPKCLMPIFRLKCKPSPSEPRTFTTRPSTINKIFQVCLNSVCKITLKKDSSIQHFPFLDLMDFRKKKTFSIFKVYFCALKIKFLFSAFINFLTSLIFVGSVLNQKRKPTATTKHL